MTRKNKSFLLDRDLIVIDLETSNANPATGSIIQLGAIIFNRNGEYNPLTFDTYIKPYTSEWEESAYQVHGLSKEFLEQRGQELGQALRDFLIFCNPTNSDKVYNHYYIAQWSCGFDSSFLKEAFFTANLEYPFSYRNYDIASIARFYLACNGFNTSRGLVECASRLNIDTTVYKAHNALHDATLTAVVLKRIIDNVLSKKDC